MGKHRLPRPTPSNKGSLTSLLIPVYFLVCLAYVCMGEAGFPGEWALLIKGSILPVLIVYFHLNVRGRYTPTRRWILIGLVFSWLGDVLLSVAFEYGLAAFLLAHLAYIWGFSRGCCWNRILRAGLPFVGPVLAYGITLYVWFYPHLGSKYLPVLFYTTAILFMLLTALARKQWVNALTYQLTVSGAVLFVLSDSLLAIRSFVSPYPLSGLFIMGTYTLAEFLIAEGGILQEA